MKCDILKIRKMKLLLQNVFQYFLAMRLFLKTVDFVKQLQLQRLSRLAVGALSASRLLDGIQNSELCSCVELFGEIWCVWCDLTANLMFPLQMGSPQQKPKLIKLLCDVSGSMYRFNGQDGRLDRQLETILMVMEAFEGYEQKIKVKNLVSNNQLLYCQAVCIMFGFVQNFLCFFFMLY